MKLKTRNENLQDNSSVTGSCISPTEDTSLREKVLAAFNFEEVRPTPYTVWYDHDTKMRIDNHYGNSDWQNMIQDHIVRITVEWRPHKIVDEDTFYDVNGSFWKMGSSPHLLKPALEEADLKGYEIPAYKPYLLNAKPHSGVKEWRGRYGLPFPDTKEIIDEVCDKVYTQVDYGYGLLETAWMIRGFQDFYMDLVLNPTFAHDLLDMVMERQLEVIDVLGELPCDGIMITDDYGNQQGVSIGPKLWRIFIKPRLEKMYARIHAAGKTVFHHSCGNFQEIIPDMLDIGLDVIQSVQPETMDVYKLKEEFGNDLCFWGAMGTQHLLPFGTPEQIRNEVRKLKREMGKNGGYVFSSCKPIMNDVPLDNVIAMIEESIAEDY